MFKIKLKPGFKLGLNMNNLLETGSYYNYLEIIIWTPELLFGMESGCGLDRSKHYGIYAPTKIEYINYCEDIGWGFVFRILGFGFSINRQQSY
jgi:hypothetical protein